MPKCLEQEQLSIINVGKLIHAYLYMGHITLAKEAFADLIWIMKEISHDEMIALVNIADVTSHAAGWMAKAWCDAHGLKKVMVEFGTAFCAGTIGATIDYRRGKATWGNLVGISEDSSAEIREKIPGEQSLRAAFSLKENNPIRLKQTTRNELKIVMGSAAIREAMSSKKDEFIDGLGSYEVKRIEAVTGIPIGKVWSSIRNGNLELVLKLGEMPSKKREQMDKKGMFVANHISPQFTFNF